MGYARDLGAVQAEVTAADVAEIIAFILSRPCRRAIGLWPMWRTAIPLALAVSALFAAFFAVGVVLIAEPGHAPVGSAMILVAVLLIGSWANEWNFGLWPLFSQVVGNLWIPVVGWAYIAIPTKNSPVEIVGCLLSF